MLPDILGPRLTFSQPFRLSFSFSGTWYEPHSSVVKQGHSQPSRSRPRLSRPGLIEAIYPKAKDSTCWRRPQMKTHYLQQANY